MPPRITLYSSSPQRRRLLRQAGLPFRAVPIDADETPPPGLSPEDTARRIAARKLAAGLSLGGGPPPAWCLAADTFVLLDGALLGKPADRAAARRMIASLSGREHRVYTGLALYARGSDRTDADCSVAAVRFRRLSGRETEAYLDSGEWRGAAGGYRIQRRGETLVEGIEGPWSAVVGLPLGCLYGMLTKMSYPFG